MFSRLLHQLGIAAKHSAPVADLERVSGPFKGYYIAVYAVPAGPGRFAGYYKICNGRPASCWECCCLLKGRGDDVPDSAAALQEAHDLGLDAIRNMPSLQRLAAFHERRTFYMFELQALLSGRDVFAGEGA